ncbi:K(+)/H(+) antiporter subunit KhtU [soil metagenome]|jgi:CPA2 family monovalent cation:H+ antiporter-2|nr:cation:proton antiporter [Deinococcota bacterium]
MTLEHVIFEVGLALALILGATLLANRLRFSAVPFLILMGMVMGPHTPELGPFSLQFSYGAPFIAFLGQLGVLFLLFYLGLEFSVGRLVRAGRSIVTGGSIYIGINLTIGLLFGALMGWPLQEVLVVAGILTISSSAIVAKLIVELKRTANPETDMILGIIMFEDVFLAVYLSVVSGLVLSGATSLVGILSAAGLALGFMLAFLILGRRLVPWLNSALDIASDEVFMFVVFAALLMIAGFGETIHVAEAIGALLVGLVLAETSHRQRIERAILPFRDFFGAVFFFSFGLSINPLLLGGAVGPALLAVLLTVIGNVAAGMLAGRSAGLSPRASTNIGLTIVSRGEFSIIMANLALAGGLLPILQPFAALYVLILAVLGPLLTKESRRIYTVFNKVFSGILARS